MKTLFITIYDRIQIKNLLLTDFFGELKANPVKIILFVPKHNVDYYRREFSGDTVIIEEIEQPKYNLLQFIVSQIAQVAVKSSTIWSFYIQRARVLKNYPKYVFYLISYALFSNPVGWKIIHWLNSIVFYTRAYSHYFEKYKPDLVFATNITAPLDLMLIRESKRRKTLTLGANKSWDTLSTKGYLDIQADIIFAQNDLQAEELRVLQGYSGKVFVVGYPWFDFFLNKEGLSGREEYFKSVGLDPNKKVIFYFLSAKFINPFPEEQMEIIDDLIEKGEIKQPAQLFVAPRPKYGFDVERIRKLKNVVVFMPEQNLRGSALDWEQVSKKDINDFRNQTFHSDVIINVTSTMSIEGALMDKPVMSLNFDPKPINYWLSAKVRHQDYHWLRLMKSNGVTEVKDKEELADWVNKYLDHPETKHADRVQIARDQNHFTDAGAGKRWASYVLKFLNGFIEDPNVSKTESIS